MKMEIAEVEALDREGLLSMWQELFRSTPPRSMSKTMLRSILAFEIQARTQGGLSSNVKRKLRENDIKFVSRTGSRLKPGARLLREWNGGTHIVDITDKGMIWNGKSFQSLSSVAKAITGAHWSGPRFFGLTSGRAL